MKAVIKAELFRLKSSRKTLACFLVMLVLLVSSVFFMDYQDRHYQSDTIKEMQQIEGVAHTRLTSFSAMSMGNAAAVIQEGIDVMDYSDQIKFWNYYCSLSRNYWLSFEHPDFFTPLRQMELENRLLAEKIIGIERQYDLQLNFSDFVEIKNAQNKVLRNTYFIETGTAFYVSPRTPNVVQYLSSLFTNYGMLAIAVVLVTLNSSIFSADFETGAYKNLYSLPVSRHTVIFSKVLCSVLVSFLIVFAALSCVVLGVYALYGAGDLNYPLLINKTSLTSLNQCTMAMVPSSEKICLVFLLGGVILVFLILLTQWVSILLKSTSNTLSIMGILLLLSLCLSRTISFDHPIMKVLPFCHILSDALLEGTVGVNPLWFIVICVSLIPVILVGLVFNIKYKDLHDQRE